ncbi:MAG: hypothetical protein ISQ34_04035 [Rickettsiales bacterium]|nr:hypothetical protein [Rickettsiales bacterium]
MPSKKKETEKKTPQKTSKKSTKTKSKKTTTQNNKNLAKEILAKKPTKKIEQPIEEVTPKEDILQKIIIAKKTGEKNKISFKIGDWAVYPSHGIGKVTDIETIEIAGEKHSCYLIFFEREKLTIKTPISSIDKIGVRHIISKKEMDEVFAILRSGVKKLKGMWSRRAQEYETKINSGDITLLAEVLRDLTRDIDDSERSYSERIIYETAIARLASEYAAIYGIDFEKAQDKVILTAKDKIESDAAKINKRIDDDDFDNFIDDDEEEDDEEDDEDDEYEDEDDDE